MYWPQYAVGAVTKALLNTLKKVNTPSKQNLSNNSGTRFKFSKIQHIIAKKPFYWKAHRMLFFSFWTFHISNYKKFRVLNFEYSKTLRNVKWSVVKCEHLDSNVSTVIINKDIWIIRDKIGQIHQTFFEWLKYLLRFAWHQRGLFLILISQKRWEGHKISV